MSTSPEVSRMTAVGDVIDALVTAATAALPEVVVSDGFGVFETVGDYLMIGVDDPELDAASSSATTQQTWAHANYTGRDEDGEITCAVMAWNGEAGNAGQKASRDSALTITATLATICREDPSLGVESLLWSTFGTQLELTQNQGQDGSTALVIFKIAFRARL